MIKNIISKFKKRKKRNSLFIPNNKTKKNINFRKKRGYNIDLSKLLNLVPKKSKNNKIIAISISVTLLIFILFLGFGPIFKIKNIEITRKDYITNIDIAYKSIDYIRGKSIFLIDGNNIKKRLQDYQKNIDYIDIDINLPNTLKILIGSYTPLFNVNIKNKNYIITENGVFLPIKHSSEIEDINLFYDKINNIHLLDYKKILDGEYLKNIKYLTNKLEENILSLKIEDISYYKNEREVHIKIDSSIILIFDLDGDLDEQIKKIVIFNKEHYSLDDGLIVYIDLRIKDKIYYCPIEEEYKCKQHLKRIYSE